MMANKEKRHKREKAPTQKSEKRWQSLKPSWLPSANKGKSPKKAKKEGAS